MVFLSENVFLVKFSMALINAQGRDGRTYYLIMPFGPKRSAWPGDGEREEGEEEEEEESLRGFEEWWSVRWEPGADAEIVSIVTPPPPFPSLVLSSLTLSKTCAQLHVQTAPLHPTAALCGQPLLLQNPSLESI